MTSDPPGPSSAPPPPNVAALVDAIDARARQAGSDGATAVMQRMLGSVTEVLGGIQDRLDQLEEALTTGDAAGGGSAGLAEAVQSGLASFNTRLGRLEEAFVQAVDESGSGTKAVVDEVRTAVVRALEESGAQAPVLERMDRLEAVLEALPGRLTTLEEKVEAAVSGRLVKLVEERMSVGLRAVTERTDEVRRAVDQLADASASRLDALATHVAEVTARPTTDVGALVQQINGALRREAELLTQRVAALAVGVEASRVLLEQQLRETENSLGRKAGEVTRRLASDFGIKTRRNGPGGRRDPRELGSG